MGYRFIYYTILYLLHIPGVYHVNQKVFLGHNLIFFIILKNIQEILYKQNIPPQF